MRSCRLVLGREQVEEQNGCGGLPCSVETRGKGDGDCTGAVTLDGQGVVGEAGEEVEAAALGEVGEEEADKGMPGR